MGKVEGALCLYVGAPSLRSKIIRARLSTRQLKLLHESGDRKMVESSRVAQKSIPQKRKRSVRYLRRR